MYRYNPAIMRMRISTAVETDVKLESKGVVGSWGGFGAEVAKLNMPKGIVVSADGSVYVSDMGNHRIQVFRPNGIFLHGWGVPGREDGQFDMPAGLCISALPELRQSLLECMAQIEELRAFPPGLMPLVVAYAGGDERLYVAELGNERIQVFDNQGTFVRKFGSIYDGPPSRCAVDPIGNAYVTYAGSLRVQLYGPDGVSLRYWNAPNKVVDISFCPTDTCLYLACEDRVVTMRSNGDVLNTFAFPDFFLSAFCLAGPGAFVIADHGHWHLYHFDRTCGKTRRCDVVHTTARDHKREPNAYDLPVFGGLALGPDAILYVTDYTHRIFKLDPSRAFFFL